MSWFAIFFRRKAPVGHPDHSDGVGGEHRRKCGRLIGAERLTFQKVRLALQDPWALPTVYSVGEITLILQRLGQGDPRAAEELMPSSTANCASSPRRGWGLLGRAVEPEAWKP